MEHRVWGMGGIANLELRILDVRCGRHNTMPLEVGGALRLRLEAEERLLI